MCIASTPKVEAPKEKEPTVIRNPYLDGVDPTLKAMRSGRSGLRIERGVAGAATVQTPTTSPEPAPGSALNMDPNTNAFGKPLGVVGRFAKAVAINKGLYQGGGGVNRLGSAATGKPPTVGDQIKASAAAARLRRPVAWRGQA